MAPRRKTKAELEASGAFRHDPKRAVGRGDPPVPTGPLGPPPEYLKADEKALWFELADIIPPRVIGNVDQFAVEVMVRIMAKARKRKATISEHTLLFRLLGKFGMTPADRRRIEVQDEEPNERAAYDPLELFLKDAPKRPPS